MKWMKEEGKNFHFFFFFLADYVGLVAGSVCRFCWSQFTEFTQLQELGLYSLATWLELVRLYAIGSNSGE